jgi:uncharacterized low-complexity protein
MPGSHLCQNVHDHLEMGIISLAVGVVFVGAFGFRFFQGLVAFTQAPCRYLGLIVGVTSQDRHDGVVDIVINLLRQTPIGSGHLKTATTNNDVGVTQSGKELCVLKLAKSGQCTQRCGADCRLGVTESIPGRGDITGVACDRRSSSAELLCGRLVWHGTDATGLRTVTIGCMFPGPTRALTLPPEGIAALQTVIGIMEDHDLPLDPEPHYRLSMLLHDMTTAVGTGPTASLDDVQIDITIDEASLLLRGLSFTEAMSTDLPWYEMVITTVHFVGDALMALWTADEWLAHRDMSR